MIPRKGDDARLNLSSNQLIHPAVGPILEGLLEQVRAKAVLHYPRPASTVEAIAGELGIPSDELIVTPGSDAAIRLICRDYARAGPDPRLLLHYPNYYAWEQAASHFEIEVRRVGWTDVRQPGSQLLEAARQSEAALVALSVPNGPIGGYVSPSCLDELQTIADERGHLLVIDSCYQAFFGELREQLHRRGPNTLVVQSLSKSHGLAGARIGLLCGCASRIARLSRYRLEHSVSAVTLELAQGVVARCKDFREIWDEIAACRRDMVRALSHAGHDPIPSGGNFLSFRADYDANGHPFVRRLSDLGYRVKDLGVFQHYRGFARVTVGDRATTRRVLPDLLDALGAGPDEGAALLPKVPAPGTPPAAS